MTKDIATGDFITDYSGIYRVINVTEGTDFRGKNCDMLFYEPVWGTDKKYTASIPLSNLKQSGFRSIITKKEVRTIYDSLADNHPDKGYNSNEAKDVIYQNDTNETIPLLKYLWMNQQSIKRADKDMMEQIIENLSREIAFVTKNKFGKVKEEITQHLNKTGH